MKTKLNFKSVVAIGAFNPAILTPSFLADRCGYKPTHAPQGRTTPVASEINFGNTQFLIELSRFQVTVKDTDSFDDVFPLDIALEYLRVLEYTPLNLCGVNFNCSISGIDITSVREGLNDIWLVGQKLGFEPISVTYSVARPDGSGLRLSGLEVLRLFGEIKNTVKVSIDDNSILLNNNFEVGQLEEDRDRIDVLASRYGDIIEQNVLLVDSLAP